MSLKVTNHNSLKHVLTLSSRVYLLEMQQLPIRIQQTLLSWLGQRTEKKTLEYELRKRLFHMCVSHLLTLLYIYSEKEQNYFVTLQLKRSLSITSWS